MNIVLVAINAKYIHTSLAVLSLYAFLDEEEKKHVQIKEFTINHQEDLIISELFKLKPDVLAFSCYIWNINIVLSVIQAFKQILPSIKVVVGGPEVADDLQQYDIDYIIKGEGEKPFKALVCSLINKAYDDTTVNMPFPYNNGFEDFKNKIIYYESTRGCLNACAYCLSGSKAIKMRRLPVDRVKEDLDCFIKAKVLKVKFVDRTFNDNALRTKAIWEYLIQNDNSITTFHFEIAGDLLTKELIDLIKTARTGLFQFEIGVQSVNPKTLSAIQRNTDIDVLLKNVRSLMILGNTRCYLDLIVGLPYEDYHSFINSFNTVMDCKPHKLHVGFLKLIKGSSLRKTASKYGIKYKSTPPYEVLSTHCMGFDVIDRLKKIEHMVDLFYNSGNFKAYMTFILSKFSRFSTPYSFFDELAQYWEENNYHLISHKKFALYAILYEFHNGNEDRLVCELLKYDMLVKENIKTFPDWIKCYYRYNNKRFTKTTAIHTFEYDILDWLKNTKKDPLTPIKREDTEITFKYNKNDL